MRHLAGALLLLSSACSATQPADQISAAYTVPRGPDGWATTAVVAEHNLPFPLDAERLMVVLDGTLVYQGVLPDQPTMVGLVELEPGDHHIALKLRASYPIGLVGDDCQVELRTSRSFSADGFARGRIAVDFHLRGTPLRALHDRLTAEVTFEGVSDLMTGHAPPDLARPEAFRAIQDPHDALPILSALVEASRAKRDIISTLCHDDKLTQAKVVAKSYDQRTRAAERATDRMTAEHERKVMALLTERARQLLQEAEQCLCEYPLFASEGHVVTLNGAGCEGDVPDLPTVGNR